MQRNKNISGIGFCVYNKKKLILVLAEVVLLGKPTQCLGNFVVRCVTSKYL